MIHSILLPDTNYRVLSFPVILLSKITWILFDSVIDFFVSILHTKEYNTLQHFICNSNLLYFSIATTISPNASMFFSTFQQFLSSLQHQLLLSSTTSRIEFYQIFYFRIVIYQIVFSRIVIYRILS